MPSLFVPAFVVVPPDAAAPPLVVPAVAAPAPPLGAVPATPPVAAAPAALANPPLELVAPVAGDAGPEPSPQPLLAAASTITAARRTNFRRRELLVAMIIPLDPSARTDRQLLVDFAKFGQAIDNGRAG
jgi:hypothetical protein